jgi:hypothetical protein
MAMFHMSNDSRLFRTQEQLEEKGWALNGERLRPGRRAVPAAVRGEDAPSLRPPVRHLRGTDPSSGQRRHPAPSQRRPARRPPLYDPPALLGARARGLCPPHQPLGPPLAARFPQCLSRYRRTHRHRSSSPRVAVGNSTPLVFIHAYQSPVLMANLTSFVLDYSARQKIGGINLNLSIPTAPRPATLRLRRVRSLASLAHPCRLDRASSCRADLYGVGPAAVRR